MPENQFRRVFEVACNNGSVVSLAQPLFENQPYEAFYEVDARKFLEAWTSRAANAARMPVFDKANGLPVIEGGVAQRRVAALLENSADVPVPLPLVAVRHSEMRKGTVIEVDGQSADVLAGLMRMGAKTLPVRATVSLTTPENLYDFDTAGKVIGAIGPAADLSQFELSVPDGQDMPPQISDAQYTNRTPVRDLALLADGGAWKLPLHQRRLEMVSEKEESLRPEGAREFEAEMKQAMDERLSGEPDLLDALEFIAEMGAERERRFGSIPEYAQARVTQMQEFEKVERLEGLDVAQEYLDCLLAAGVHGVSIPSPRDGRGIVSALEPLVREAKPQLDSPTGTPEQLVDRFATIVERLEHRVFDHQMGNATLQGVQRLQALAMPLGRAVVDTGDVRLIARDLSGFTLQAVKWIANNTEAPLLESWGLAASKNPHPPSHKMPDFR